MDTAQKIAVIKEWLGTGSINIFGPPFAGKDTHGRELVTLFGGVLLGGGDILRNSVIPQHVTELISAGKLAPTEDYIRIVLPYLSQDQFADKPLILSSVGRWHGEEPGVLEAAKDANHPIKAVLYLNISEDAIRKRWTQEAHSSRGERPDDTQEALEIRLGEFRDKTLPVIEFYRQMGLLIEVDSSLDKPVTFELIIDGLYKQATK